MKALWLGLVLAFHALVAVATDAAPDSVAIGCQRLSLVLDARITPEVLARDWATGESRTEAPAVLELRGCQGEVLDRMTLAAPMAKLDPTPLRGAPAPTYLVTADLTAPAGSYSGPLTLPVQVSQGHLQAVQAMDAEGRTQAIRLALTGKAAWQRQAQKTSDELLFVTSQPQNPGFVTYLYRYRPSRQGWHMSVRSEPGLWESDGDFPAARRFAAITGARRVASGAAGR